MLSEEQLELIENFSELRSIGQELADRITLWNDTHLDEENCPENITQDMSGDAIAVLYTEKGFDDSDIVKMLQDIEFRIIEESDDTLETDIKTNYDVDESLNSFLMQCIEVSNAYPCFVKKIELQPGNPQRKEEVRIIIPSDSDFRKLSHTDAKKIMFMHFLKDIREKATKYSMLDEAMCFCSRRQEFLIVLKPLAMQKSR